MKFFYRNAVKHGENPEFEIKTLVEGVKKFSKIYMTCLQALRDGLDYVWVDTCCIDKSSSAELSEAINSMYD